MAVSRNVPGQAEGYYLQETRFLSHLLDAKSGDVVCLEFFGDVATEHSDGTITTEEDKSSISGNPVTDRSINLWKTFYNWIQSVEQGHLDPSKTTFRIYVPYGSYTGDFIERLHNANTTELARETIEYIKHQLWGNEPDYNLKTKVSDSISKYIDCFFDQQEIVANIIPNFEHERGGFAGYEDIDKRLVDSLVPEEHIETYRRQILGWIKECIDKLISSGNVARISRDEYVKEGKLFLRKLDRQGILNSVASRPSDKQIINQIDLSPNYIRQLDFIKQEFDEKLNAVCDFMMAEDDRYYWIEKGLIHNKSAQEFETNLTRTWNNITGEVKATYVNLEPERQGAAVYFKCKQHKAKIEQSELPAHFVPGTFHLLADRAMVGWHPDWEILRKKIQETSEIASSTE